MLDEDQSGTLDGSEQRRLVYGLLPQSSEDDVAFLETMLTAGGRSKELTFKEFQARGREARGGNPGGNPGRKPVTETQDGNPKPTMTDRNPGRKPASLQD